MFFVLENSFLSVSLRCTSKPPFISRRMLTFHHGLQDKITVK